LPLRSRTTERASIAGGKKQRNEMGKTRKKAIVTQETIHGQGGPVVSEDPPTSKTRSTKAKGGQRTGDRKVTVRKGNRHTFLL